jgi:hypothetical protein
LSPLSKDRLANLFDRLLARTEGPKPVEVLAVGLLLLAIASIVYGSYVAHGGFYLDDWSDASGYHFADAPRYWSEVADQNASLGGRPVAALLLPLPHALFGVHPEPHLVLAVGVGVLVSLLLYLLLRVLTLPPLHAGAVAVLALLFPWSDVIRLWPIAGVLSLSLAFLLLGVAVALRGLRRRGRAGIAIHAGADLLYLFSVLTYQATAGAALLAGLLYLGRAPRPLALRRWLADIVVILAAVGYSLATTGDKRHVGSISDRLADIGPFLHQSAILLAEALVPVGHLGTAAVGLILAAVAAIVALALIRSRRPDQLALRAWLQLGAVGVLVIGAAYFMFLGSRLHPGDPGIDMRTNILAGLAYCLLAYAIVATASLLLFRSRLRAALATLAATALIAIGYAVQTKDDEATWERSATLQSRLLGVVDRALLPLPARSTVLTFDYPAQAGPEVPIFNKSWDLNGAVKLETNDSTVRAFPVYTGVSLRCGPGRVIIDGAGNYGNQRARYGRLFFLDVPAGRAERIRTPAQCRQALRSFHPGPQFA